MDITKIANKHRLMIEESFEPETREYIYRLNHFDLDKKYIVSEFPTKIYGFELLVLQNERIKLLKQTGLWDKLEIIFVANNECYEACWLKT